jgi:hypothetical protein
MSTEEASEGTSALAPMDYARLYGRQFGIVGDMYLAVVGAALVALAVVVVLDGFGFVEVGLSGSTGAVLGSGLVIAVLGLFALGVASEGPMTGKVYEWPEIQLAIARALGIVLVGVGGLLAANLIDGFFDDLGAAFAISVEVLRVASRAGFFFALPVGVVGTWALRTFYPRSRDGLDRTVLLAVWVIGALVLLPGAL